jgi:prevent-host-death family protein
MAKRTRKKTTKVPLSEIKNNLSKFIRKAGSEDIVVTIHGRPAAVIIGFEDEDDWLDWLLLHDEAFMERMAESMRQYHGGEYVTLDAV